MDKKVQKLILDIFEISGNMTFVTFGFVQEQFQKIYDSVNEIIDMLSDEE